MMILKQLLRPGGQKICAKTCHRHHAPHRARHCKGRLCPPEEDQRGYRHQHRIYRTPQCHFPRGPGLPGTSRSGYRTPRGNLDRRDVSGRLCLQLLLVSQKPASLGSSKSRPQVAAANSRDGCGADGSLWVHSGRSIRVLAEVNGIFQDISGSRCQIIKTSISEQPLSTRWITAGRFGRLDHEHIFGDAYIARRVIEPAVRELYIQRRETLKTTPKIYVGL